MDKLTNNSPFIKDKIKENTNINGDILCIYCQIGYMLEKNKTLTVSNGFGSPKKSVNIQTLVCNVCDGYVMDDEQTKQIRKKI